MYLVIFDCTKNIDKMQAEYIMQHITSILKEQDLANHYTKTEEEIIIKLQKIILNFSNLQKFTHELYKICKEYPDDETTQKFVLFFGLKMFACKVTSNFNNQSILDALMIMNDDPPLSDCLTCRSLGIACKCKKNINQFSRLIKMGFFLLIFSNT